MATPKRKKSKAKRDKRRSHLALSAPGLYRCPNCDELTEPHRVCSHCGYYKGRSVIEVEEV